MDFHSKTIVGRIKAYNIVRLKRPSAGWGKKYKLHLPSNIPASDFWSIIVYDQPGNFIIHTDQPWPSVFSSDKNLIYNNDGSVDTWFGPESIKEKRTIG